MANIYIRSTDGSDTDDGSTWALAKATAAGAAAIDAAGDNLYFSSAHSESSGSAISLALAGTAGNPVKLLSVSDAAEPPTTLTAGATITTTGSASITVSGFAYIEGMSFTSAGAITTCGSSSSQYYKSCKFRTNNTGSSGNISVTPNNVLTRLVMESCTFYFTNAANKITAQHYVHIIGASMEAGSATPTALITMGADGRGGKVLVEASDLSGFGAGMHLVASSMLGSGEVIYRNCKLPASWTGDLTGGAMANPGLFVWMFNCDSGDTNYRVRGKQFAGELRDETTLVKTGGATDGTTPASRKIVTNSSTNYPNGRFRSLEMARWNETVGSSITVTIDILHDSATNLTDGDVWVEVQYLGTSGFPLGSIITDAKANILATAADQASSSATWTTTGMTNPNKQKLSVTFTPQEKGTILATVVVAKASYTLYYDHDMVIS